MYALQGTHVLCRNAEIPQGYQLVSKNYLKLYFLLNF